VATTDEILKGGVKMRILRAIPSEYDRIQRFLEDVYGHSFNYFPSAYPSVWKRQNSDFKNIFVIKEKDKIVSLVRIFPLRTIQNCVEMNLAGIGAVSTLYSHRGKGYMGILLQHTFDEMKRQKFPLSILGGDRHRYGNFGYENGGRVIEITILSRGLKKFGIQAVPARRYDNTNKEVLGKIIKASEKMKYRKKRTAKEFDDVYKRQGINVYYAEEGRNFAFVVVSAIEVKDAGIKNVMEFGGDNKIIPGILQHLIERFGYSGFSIIFPDFSEIPGNLLSLASSWDIRSELMIKIVDIRQTLETLAKREDFLFPDNEELTFTVKDRESVVINKKGRMVKINSGKGKNEVVLTEIEMVRLLFGTSFWAPEGLDKKIIQVLRQFLPLNIFLPPLDCI